MMTDIRIETIPPAVQAIASVAREVLICFPGRLPKGLVESLRLLAPSFTALEFQCPTATEPDVIMTLLQSRHQVFEARDVPLEAEVIFDRRYGFCLPAWAALPDPFDAAYKWVWSRTAAFARVRGNVMTVIDNPAADFTITRLVENPRLRLSVPKAIGIPTIGQRLAFLGRHDFNFGMETPLLQCLALFTDDRATLD